jgi:hypothetical protein
VTAPVAPKPAASVLLVRAGAGSPLEVYMIRRQKGMRFLGGYYPRFFEWFDLATEALFDALGLPWPELFPKPRSTSGVQPARTTVEAAAPRARA